MSGAFDRAVRTTMTGTLAKLHLTIAAVGLLLALSGCGSPQERATKAVARYDVFYAQRDFVHALIEIKAAIREQDDVPDYWNKLGRVELSLSKYYNAFSAYSRTIELDKNNIEALQAVAELSYSGGAPGDAVKFADQMLALEPRNLRMMLIKGSVAYDQRRFDDARGIGSEILKIDPTNEGATILMARIQAGTGDTKGGIATLEESVRTDGTSMLKLIALLDFYRKQDDFAGQDATYLRMFKLESANVVLWLDYAKALYQNGQPDRALVVIDKIQRRFPKTPKLQQQIVDLWVSVGSKAIAVDQIKRFADAGSVQMKMALAQLAIGQKRYAEAQQILQPLIGTGKIVAENVQANVLYAAALSGLGRTAEALALANRALAFDKTNPQALLLRIQIAIGDRRLADALTDAQLLQTENPDLASSHIALAQVYTLRKERILADGVFARAAEDLPNNLGLLTSYLSYLIDSDRRSQALDVAREFTRRNPDMVDGWKTRGNLCVTLDDDRCLQDVLDRLSHLPGGEIVREALVAAKAEKAKGAPAVSSDVGATRQRMPEGKARQMAVPYQPNVNRTG